jgi:hypothetical protein
MTYALYILILFGCIPCPLHITNPRRSALRNPRTLANQQVGRDQLLEVKEYERLLEFRVVKIHRKRKDVNSF